MTGDPALARSDAVDTRDLLAGLMDLLPAPPAPILDVGAGSGRDAAWFCARGHRATAAEPIPAFRALIAARAPQASVVAAADMPSLDGVSGRFALILVSAVWHHLSSAARTAAIGRLAGWLEGAGRILLSLRQVPVPRVQLLFPLDPDAEIARAATAGVTLLRRHDAPPSDPALAASLQTWTWLVLQRETAA